MARFTERFAYGRWWTAAEFDQLKAAHAERTRDRYPSPMVIRDSLDDMWNPVNGQAYDSKRAFEKAVRAHGCEIMGNDAPTEARGYQEAPGLEQDIKNALEQLNAG